MSTQLKIERWKDIPGLDGYQVSDHGNIKSFRRYKDEGRLLKTAESDWGLRYFRTGTHRQKFYVSKLVAEAFLTNPDPMNLKRVSHRDGNLGNDHFENLVWVK